MTGKSNCLKRSAWATLGQPKLMLRQLYPSDLHSRRGHPSSHRLICASRYPESDTQTVPAIDGDNRDGQVDQFFVRELPAGLLEYVLRRMPHADQRDRLCPCQSGPFAVCVERRLAPCVKRVEPLLCLTVRPRILRMHVDAISATIDL